jgi:hypothetical protein
LTAVVCDDGPNLLDQRGASGLDGDARQNSTGRVSDHAADLLRSGHAWNDYQKRRYHGRRPRAPARTTS